MNEAVSSIAAIVEGLKLDYPKLTHYELLSRAVEKQRNEILIKGLKISPSGKHPSSLEAISMQLGFKNDGMNINLVDAITEKD